MFRFSAVIAIAGIMLAIVGTMTAIGWLVLTGVAILIVSVVLGALAPRSAARRTHHS